MKRIVLTSFVAVGLSAGCLNTIFPLAPDQLFETQVRADCSFLFRCCEANERSIVTGGGTSPVDEGNCVEQRFEAGGEGALLGQRAKAAVDAGKAEHDGALADECLRPILDQANACDPAFLTPKLSAACSVGAGRGFVVGLVKDGDECNDTLECADEGTCVIPEDDTVVTTKGKCFAAVSEGDSCVRGAEGEQEILPCKSGLTCSFNGDGTAECKAVELLADGESCFDGRECESGECIEAEVKTCSFSDERCAVDADCEDADLGEICDAGVDDVCGTADIDVAICNGRE